MVTIPLFISHFSEKMLSKYVLPYIWKKLNLRPFSDFSSKEIICVKIHIETFLIYPGPDQLIIGGSGYFIRAKSSVGEI